MPFRIDPEKFPDRTKIQFVTAVKMPSRIHKACVATGIPSNTVYIQRAVCEALSRDLGIPLEELLAELPPSRKQSNSPIMQRERGIVETVQ